LAVAIIPTVEESDANCRAYSVGAEGSILCDKSDRRTVGRGESVVCLHVYNFLLHSKILYERFESTRGKRVKAFIPAKGYSRRLPRKNAKLMCGHPLTAWSIVQALSSKYVDEVYVSTDDDEIAEITLRYGGTVVWRNYEQGPDDGGGVPLYEGIKAIPITDETFVNMFATSPLRLPGMIDKMVEAYRPEMKVIGALGLERETFIYKRLNDEEYDMVIGTKDYSYLKAQNSTAITNTQYSIDTFEWSIENIGITDTANDEYGAAVDRGEVELISFDKIHNIKRYYFPVDMWQTWEPDTPEDFDVCGALLETMILKGRSMEEVYGS